MNEPRLEEVLAALGVPTNGEGPRQFTAAGRLSAARYARGRVGSGATVETVAAELKLKKWTLLKWMQREGRGELAEAAEQKPGFMRVRVKRSEPSAAALVLHGGHGVRVEGLTLESLATLLERLGCSA